DAGVAEHRLAVAAARQAAQAVRMAQRLQPSGVGPAPGLLAVAVEDAVLVGPQPGRLQEHRRDGEPRRLALEPIAQVLRGPAEAVGLGPQGTAQLDAHGSRAGGWALGPGPVLHGGANSLSRGDRRGR